MPHLSPMNWLLAITSIWFLLSCLMSMTWWQPNLKWPLTNYNKSNSSTNKWNWS